MATEQQREIRSRSVSRQEKMSRRKRGVKKSKENQTIIYPDVGGNIVNITRALHLDFRVLHPIFFLHHLTKAVEYNTFLSLLFADVPSSLQDHSFFFSQDHCIASCSVFSLSLFLVSVFPLQSTH